MIGRKLGTYQITAKLGEGGMGEVYRATDSRLNRDVALKVLSEELAGSQERLERFRREAEVLAALDHPNIVTLFSIEEAEGIQFLTMALSEGESLDKLIPSSGLALARFLELAVPLIDAARAAHEQGIVHRDLKPSNVMVDEGGRLRVLDFGLAKLRPTGVETEFSQSPTEAMTREGAILGTYPYMSPEQVEGKPVDARSDIFSLGTVLYEMATGGRPFSGENSASVIAAILKEAPPTVDEVRSDLPTDLGRIVGKCLEKDPERRYQRAKDLLYELENLDLDRSRSAPSGTGVLGVRKGLYATLGAVVVAVVGLGFYINAMRPTPPPDPTAGPIRSIAVLPLANLMNDPQQDYFADGMTAALISDLGKVGSLRIISRQSVMQFKGSTQPLSEIAEQLGVDAVVEGSVLAVGDQVNLTVQLIATNPERQLWSQSYERALKDVLRLHGDLAQTIAEEVDIALTPEEEALLASAPQVDPEAYRLTLRGFEALQSASVASFEEARKSLERALELDPDFAMTHLGMAAYWGLGATMGLHPPREAIPKTRAAVLKSLELDENLAMAHSLLGETFAYQDWDWEAAESSYRRALELNPNLADTHRDYAHFLGAMGRNDDATLEWDRALLLAPLGDYGSLRAFDLAIAGRAEAAVAMFEQIVKERPGSAMAYWGLWLARTQMGEGEDGLLAARRLLELMGHGEVADVIGGVAATDYREALRLGAEALAAKAEVSYVSAVHIAEFFAQAGEDEQALDWLERAFEARDPPVAFFGVYPAWDHLRQLPRFQELLARLNLPQSQPTLTVSP